MRSSRRLIGLIGLACATIVPGCGGSEAFPDPSTVPPLVDNMAPAPGTPNLKDRPPKAPSSSMLHDGMMK